ncbi:iron complex transport system substrate-binding protein [Acidovorax sp. 62]|uniref:ABC transporter substrate-binding protein n=1 Tax=Acidovorax sp. 62 TaxID=2035203 RepID=UPI000C17E99C|nr:helical backbone metal receptor [Acidovorax sp. 62]PIF91024.1 iron complex transport system substrate-binding protein [Acidovorax sp. 62]
MKPTPVRRILWVIAILIVLGLLMAGLARAQPVQVTDDRGRAVTLPRPPQRIVSLLPSLTETICALDQCHRLVGVDRYSNYPASVQKLPKVGGGLDPNIEAIVALRPDVVVMSVSSRAGERLEALGVKVVTLEPKTHADVQRVLGTMARLLGQPDDAARKVWRVIDAAVSAAAQSLAPEARNTRVYFEVSRGPYGAGESSFIGETLTRLGVKNIVPASLGPFPRLNPEFVVRANPDLIMMGNRSMQNMVPYPGWDTIKAVREQRLCVYGPDDSDTVVRPGPRMAEAARLMAQCINDKMARKPQAANSPATRP